MRPGSGPAGAIGTAEIQLYELINLGGRIDLAALQLGLQVMQLVGIGLLRQNRRPVVVGKRLLDGVGIILKVENEYVVLLRVGAIQARQRLNCFDSGQDLVYIHRVQERLVIAGLEFVGAHQKSVRVFLYAIRDEVARESV